MLLCNNNCKPRYHSFNPKVTMYKSVQSADGNVVTRKAVVEVVDNTVIGNYYSYDFSVQNLVAIGANDVLKRHYVGSISTLGNADIFEPSNVG